MCVFACLPMNICALSTQHELVVAFVHHCHVLLIPPVRRILKSRGLIVDETHLMCAAEKFENEL